LLGLALKLNHDVVQVLRTTTYSSVHSLSVDVGFDVSHLSYMLVSCLSAIALNPSNYTMGNHTLDVEIEVENFLHVIRKFMDLNKTMLVYLFPPILFPIPSTFAGDHEAAMKSVRTFADRHRRVYVVETFAPSQTHVYSDKPKLKTGGVTRYMEHSFASLTIMYNDFLTSDEPVELVMLYVLTP